MPFAVLAAIIRKNKRRKTAVLGIAYFAVYLLAGYALIRDLLPGQRLPVRVWLGAALGIVLMMWLPALLAFACTFSVKAHMLALLPLCGLFTGRKSNARKALHSINMS